MAEVLNTARLTLEPLRAGHAGEVYPEFLDERLWMYFPALRPSSLAALRAQFALWSAGAPHDVPDLIAWRNWIAFLRGTRTAVGHFQATILSAGRAHVAYLVLPAHQRRGYATEAMQAVVGALRSTDRIERVIADMDGRNAASIALARRLGFAFAGEGEPGDSERTGAVGTEYRYELAVEMKGQRT